jgi:ferredoxin
MAGQIALIEKRRTKPLLFDKGMSRMGELEKRFTSIFGKHIKVSPSCIGCGKCARDCPSGNITMADGKPVFSNKCLLCMKCLYECPQKAIAPKYAKFFVLKDGFPMEQWAKADIQMDKNEFDKAAKGYFWSGVRKYLQEQDKSI